MSHTHLKDAVGTLNEFKNGCLTSEECFCMILSLLGEEYTKDEFPNIMRIGALPQNGSLWRQLCNVYSEYFASRRNIDVTGDSEHSSCFGEELDIELAIALSREEENTPKASSATFSYNVSSAVQSQAPSSVSHVPQSYADKIKSLAKNKTDESANILKEKTNPSTLGTKNVSNVHNPSHSELVEPDHPAQQSKFQNPSEGGTGKSKQKKKKKRIQQGPLRHISNNPVLYWLRRDLRLHDNPALVAAFEKNAPVVITFLWNEKEEGPLAAGGATKYWLHFALKELNTSIQEEYGNRIVFRGVESSQREILSLARETGARTVVFNNLYEPCLKTRDDKISASLVSQGIEVQRFDSYLLHEPSSVSIESKGYRGFGSVLHFMECCRRSPSAQSIGLPVDKPAALPACASTPQCQSLDGLGLARLPRRRDGSIIDWAKVIRESWDFSEDGAWNALELFVDGGIRNYEKESGRSDQLNTSRISPYLHFGQVSPRAVLRYAQGLRSPKFLRKLAWRDLSYFLLSKFPDMPTKPIRVHYQAQQWSENRAHLKAWQKGQTGYPLVDAAMRQLWLTGWMNNYMRHVVASFLISYLYLHWVHGYNWFQDTLLDADVAINAMMWQNGGMSGLDQWNFVMHPVDAAMTCDPKGEYVRRWCPELSGVPDDFVHKPWKCAPSVLRRAGVELGKNYPHRIITDLESAREHALQDVVAVRLANPHFVDAMGNDLVPLPTGRLLPVITRREFKYKTSNPDAKDNPHTAVLRGYRSRKRDEAIAFANQVDFTASTMNECALRHKRYEQANRLEL